MPVSRAVPSDQPLPSKQLCHLNLFAVDGGGSAEANAKLNLKVANAEGSARVAGRANMVSYRFQTLGCGGPQPVVITRDTVVTYREVDVEAAAKAKLDITIPVIKEPKEIERDKEYSRQYRTMTYHSAVAYWLYPSELELAPQGVTLGNGSGVSFGFGVQVSRLIQLAKELVGRREASPQEVGPASAKLLARIASQLRVPNESIEEFLVGAGIEDDDPEQYKTDVVLLEAGFALPPNKFVVPMKRTRDSWQLLDMLSDKGLVGAMKDPKTLEAKGLLLSALRLRYRISDGRDRAETVFKLGFSYVAGLDFSVDKVKTSGHEGVIDLHTWFANHDHNANPILGHEEAVPPVALLHQ